VKENRIPEPAKGLIRIWKALFYSLDGLRHGFLNEAAVRQEIILCIILIPAALMLPVSGILKLVLVICHFAVLITELLNSAVEAVVDRLCPGYDPMAKQAKDMGSAAVFLSLLSLAAAWGLALWQSFFQ